MVGESHNLIIIPHHFQTGFNWGRMEMHVQGFKTRFSAGGNDIAERERAGEVTYLASNLLF